MFGLGKKKFDTAQIRHEIPIDTPILDTLFNSASNEAKLLYTLNNRTQVPKDGAHSFSLVGVATKRMKD